MARSSRRHLLRPLVVISAACPLLLGLLLCVAQSRARQSQMEDQTLQRLKEWAHSIQSLAGPEFSELATLPPGHEVRLQLMAGGADARLMADSAATAVPFVPDSAHDVYLARNFGEGLLTSDESDGKSIAYSLKVDDSGRVLRLSQAVPQVSAVPDSASLALIISATLLSAGAAFVVSGRIERPLAGLTSALRDLQQLAWHTPVRVTGDFAEVGQVFNETVEVLHREFQRQQVRSAELERQAHFLEAVLGSMVEGVVVVDASQRVVYSNPTALRMLTMAVDSGRILTGRQLLEIVRLKVIDEAVRRVLVEHYRQQVEFELPRTARRVSMFVIRLPGDPVPGAVLVLHDVTDLRRLETTRRDFVQNASHELKTPLASIQAYVETLLNGALADAPTAERFLARIAEQSERLGELIEDLLQLARIESGNEAFQIRSVPLAAAIKDCVAASQPVAAGRQVQLSFEAGPEGLNANADARSLRTILDNLIGNAVKYTPAGGRVRVRWGQAGTQVRIDVIDTGVGIPREHLGRIFERFYRVDEARSRDVGGTGLGLAIVKHLVQVFGGHVTVESTPGTGSTFTVFLPLT